MRKQFVLKQVCGLVLGVAGALAPLGSAQSADELSDRYLNGYLNDPYTNEVAADTQSVLHGAQGPVRDDSATSTSAPMKHASAQREVPAEMYTGYIGDEPTTTRGAQGPVRDDSAAFATKPMKQQTYRREVPAEMYTGFVNDDADTNSGAQGPIRVDDMPLFADEPLSPDQKASLRKEE